ncbi:MAG: M6 family metalloprotease domain-containing protein [Acidobacteriota bacterium]|nr:M6 family metalloprotease domain-containing protein [Acidobacteriota bacterium]
MTRQRHCVPPSPHVIGTLLSEYKRDWQGRGFTFLQFLDTIGYGVTSHAKEGKDDPARGRLRAGNIELLSIPQHKIDGKLHVIALMVDFSDLQGATPKDHYQDLLFSGGRYPTGSMTDYYHEVSRGKVEITGEVHGWFRMPEKYDYYVNDHSGLDGPFGQEYYPRDARKLAEDAVEVARANGVTFGRDLDKLGDSTITALFIIHAGRPAEKLNRYLGKKHIWSHKWVMKNPVLVSAALELWAVTYLMVPQEATLGVCAHELGHLAFQWQDFYDPNYDEDGDHWDGNGIWDLMAGGSYAGDELRPVHPAVLHKLQHRWIEVEEISASKAGIELKPVTAQDGKVLKIVSSVFSKGQYFLLEYRAMELFDAHLPEEGLLVWRVDESAEMEGSGNPGMLLIQADGRHDLITPGDYNVGDAGDPFPGSQATRNLLDEGVISTSFPNQPKSGISIKNIQLDRANGKVRFDVEIVDH